MAEQSEKTSAVVSSGPPGAEAAPALPAPAYASIGERLLAQIVDVALAFGLFFFIGMSLAPRFGGTTESGFELEGWPAALVITVTSVPLLAYFVLAEGLFGATLGKIVAGIRVERLAGGKIGFTPALLRNLLRVIDVLAIYLVGAIVIMVSKHKQRVGDLVAGSVVVRRQTGKAARIAALIAVLILLAAGVVGGLMLRGEGTGPRAEAPAPPAESAPSPPGAQPQPTEPALPQITIPQPTAEAPAVGVSPGPGAAPPDAGYPIPDMTGFTHKGTFKRDMVFQVPGDESTADRFENDAGNIIFRFTTGTVVWGYGWVPRQDQSAEGYIIRDPNCGGRFTERLASNVRLIAPDCAAATIKGP